MNQGSAKTNKPRRLISMLSTNRRRDEDPSNKFVSRDGVSLPAIGVRRSSITFKVDEAHDDCSPEFFLEGQHQPRLRSPAASTPSTTPSPPNSKRPNTDHSNHLHCFSSAKVAGQQQANKPGLCNNAAGLRCGNKDLQNSGVSTSVVVAGDGRARMDGRPASIRVTRTAPQLDADNIAKVSSYFANEPLLILHVDG